MNLSLRIAERRLLLVLVDLLLVNATTLLALWIFATRGLLSFDRAFVFDQIGWFFLLSALWLLSAWLNDCYDPRKIADLATALPVLLRTAALVMIAYIVIYFFFAEPGSTPRALVGYQGVSGFILIGLWRVLYVTLEQRPGFARKVIIVGAGWAGQTIAEAIQQFASAPYRIVGFVDDDPTKQGKPGSGDEGKRSADDSLRVIGTSRDLVRLVKDHGVPEIILAITHEIGTPTFQGILECKEQGVQITLMPVLFEQLTGRIPIEHIGDNWNVALPLDAAESGGFYPIAKRLFDIMGALIGLCFFVPLLPFIALALYLDSPGPIFYTHERVGRGGKTFKLIKLRTMILAAEREGHAVRARAGDPRITRVGRLLRKARLDEMPQLLNILKGNMSAVGPRPERPEHLAELDRMIPFHRLRNAVKPGMAGWAVVNSDYVDSIEAARTRLEYDLYYIKHQSLWLDAIILLRMIGNVFALKGR